MDNIMASLTSPIQTQLFNSTQTIRELIVQEARTWIGTPYHRRAAIKGVGVDCGMLAYAVYRKFDILPQAEFDWLPDDWWLHTSQEKYLLMCQRYLKGSVCVRLYRDMTENFKAGNLVLTKACGSRVFNHAAIISKWPRVIQAIPPVVNEVDAAQDINWTGHEVLVFDIGVE